MSAMDLLTYSFPISKKIKKSEKIILEAEIFYYIYNQLKKRFRLQYKGYLNLLKNINNKDDEMIESCFSQIIIKDILMTGEYDLRGISSYTGIIEDALFEVLSGQNETPSAQILLKLIALHRTVRTELYTEILRNFSTISSQET